MKAILVIDMPPNCLKCRIREICRVHHYEMWEKLPIGYYDINDRPLRCPLKPMPKKINTDFCSNIVYANGWNACLEEIEG